VIDIADFVNLVSVKRGLELTKEKINEDAETGVAGDLRVCELASK
jgi:hypothetical protein